MLLLPRGRGRDRLVDQAVDALPSHFSNGPAYRLDQGGLHRPCPGQVRGANGGAGAQHLGRSLQAPPERSACLILAG